MSLFNDCLARDKSRRAAREAQKPFQVVKLTNAGIPSKMHDAVKAFDTQTDAIHYVTMVRGLNPGKKLRYSLNSVEI